MPTFSFTKLAPTALLVTSAVAWPASFTYPLPAITARGQQFGAMNIPTYEAAADTSCVWTNNVPSSGYVVGNEYKLWIGNKADGANATVGMVYQVGTADKATSQPIPNPSYFDGRVAFHEIDWTATDVDSVELKAICGTSQNISGKPRMWIAEPVTLQKAASTMTPAPSSAPSSTPSPGSVQPEPKVPSPAVGSGSGARTSVVAAGAVATATFIIELVHMLI